MPGLHESTGSYREGEYSEEDLRKHQDMKIRRENGIAFGAFYRDGPLSVDELKMDEILKARTVGNVAVPLG
jgi:hypothetical protein